MTYFLLCFLCFFLVSDCCSKCGLTANRIHYHNSISVAYQLNNVNFLESELFLKVLVSTIQAVLFIKITTQSSFELRLISISSMLMVWPSVSVGALVWSNEKAILNTENQLAYKLQQQQPGIILTYLMLEKEAVKLSFHI